MNHLMGTLFESLCCITTAKDIFYGTIGQEEIKHFSSHRSSPFPLSDKSVVQATDSTVRRAGRVQSRPRASTVRETRAAACEARANLFALVARAEEIFFQPKRSAFILCCFLTHSAV